MVSRPEFAGTRSPAPRMTSLTPYVLLVCLLRHRRRGLDRVLDGGEGREFDVIELAVLLLDLTDVDVLHDVTRQRVDRNRAARALPGHTLDRRDQRVAVGLAAGLF